MAALVAALTVPCHAAVGDFYYDFSQMFGGTAPSSTPPWIRAVLQTIEPGQVRLTVQNLNLTGTENVDQLYFNLNPALTFSSLRVVTATGIGFDAPRVALGEDQFKAGGDGRYDLKFTFASGGGAGSRFTAGESFVCDFFSASLSASDFAFLSKPVGGAGPFYAAAHVQRIGSGSTSGWLAPLEGAKPLPIPEPTSAVTLILGGIILASLRTWRSK